MSNTLQFNPFKDIDPAALPPEAQEALLKLEIGGLRAEERRFLEETVQEALPKAPDTLTVFDATWRQIDRHPALAAEHNGTDTVRLPLETISLTHRKRWQGLYHFALTPQANDLVKLMTEAQAARHDHEKSVLESELKDFGSALAEANEQSVKQKDENQALRKALARKDLYLNAVAVLIAAAFTVEGITWLVRQHDIALRQNSCDIVQTTAEGENIWFCPDGEVHLLGEKRQ